MLRVSVFFILLLSSSSVFAEATVSIQKTKNCFRGPFENYEKWLSFLENKNHRFSQEEFSKRFPEQKFQMLKSSIDCVDFIYNVDGLIVEGYYIKPKDTPDKKLPVLIYNRGGNASHGYVNFGTKMSYLADFALAGNVVVGSQYRGASEKYIKNNGSDEFGGADVRDVTALTDLLDEIPNTNPSIVSMMGWSRGGMQTYIAAKSMPHLSSIIIVAGNVDARKALEWRPMMEKVYQARIPDFIENRVEALSERSAVDWLDDLPKVPLLLIHGDQDKRVSVEQSRTMARLFANAKRPYKLVVYPEGDHGLHKHRTKMKEEVLKWLKQHH